jgi:hypothetical protein
MVQEDTTICIYLDTSTGLVKMQSCCEAQSKLSRDHANSTFSPSVLGIELLNRCEPGVVVGLFTYLGEEKWYVPVLVYFLKERGELSFFVEIPVTELIDGDF